MQNLFDGVSDLGANTVTGEESGLDRGGSAGRESSSSGGDQGGGAAAS